MKELLQKRRQLIAVYVVWFFMHLVFLFLSDQYYSEYFWPFERGAFDNATLRHAYDKSEFLVYAIGPGVIIIAWMLFTKKD